MKGRNSKGQIKKGFKLTSGGRVVKNKKTTKRRKKR